MHSVVHNPDVLLPPPDRCARAQADSIVQSPMSADRKLDRTGTTETTKFRSGWGSPAQKLESAHKVLRREDQEGGSLMRLTV